MTHFAKILCALALMLVSSPAKADGMIFLQEGIYGVVYAKTRPSSPNLTGIMIWSLTCAR